MENAYETMSGDYMESVRHIFKNIYDQGKIYKGKRVSMYSTKLNTAIGNFEVQADNSYADLNDPAITVKFRINNIYHKDNLTSSEFEQTEDGAIRVVSIAIKNDKWEVLSYINESQWVLQIVGGKVDKWETIEQAIIREWLEEIWYILEDIIYVWSSKKIGRNKLFHIDFFETQAKKEPENKEPSKHTYMKYRSIDDFINISWEEYNIEKSVFDLMKNIYTYSNMLWDKPIYFLARTTTPWTIPANVALVVNPELDYAQIFDIKTQEYYILAHDLIAKYYKNPEDYIYIYRCKWSELIGIWYEAPFDYYSIPPTPLFKGDWLQSNINSVQSNYPFEKGVAVGGGINIQNEVKSDNISDIYNNHKVYAADYVTATDGTGIVHTAPEFGEDDFATGKKYNLYQTNALNEEWRYTSEVYDMKWLYYRKDDDTVVANQSNANDEVMRKLTEKWLLFRKESITHTVPMCPRTQTPLIYKTQDSRFIDINSIKPQLLAQNENINRVPSSVKYSRFAKSIETAPDRCISRTKYWATPMPVWIAKDIDGNTIDTKVMWSREDIYNLDQTGSKIMTKYIYIRHWETDYNELWIRDDRWDAILNKNWILQADSIVAKINNIDFDNSIIAISPMYRAFQTAKPYIKLHIWEKINELELEYIKISEIYKKLFDTWDLVNYLKSSTTQKQFQIYKNIYVDFRITEECLPSLHKSTKKPWENYFMSWSDNPISEWWESYFGIFERVSSFIIEYSKPNYKSNIICFSHWWTWRLFKKYFFDYDYEKDRNKYSLHNCDILVNYLDKSTKQQFDFHRPYIDTIWWQELNKSDNSSDIYKKYIRTSEVLDPWMDSGSMPFAQLHYPFENADKFEAWFPADFIAEWTGQIRCRFQMMHNISTLITGKNAYKNVVVTGTVQWNDWRKMSKSFGNYPDIRPTIEKFGGDSVRMFLLSSPLMAWGDLAFSEDWLKEVIRKISLPLRNSYSFFTTYANIDNFVATKHSINDFVWFEFQNDLDERIISKMAILITEVNAAMLVYDIQSAIKPIYIFVEDLTNRYIRRNRRRFRKSENDHDKMTGYDVLYVVLTEFCKVIAPFMPFLPEYIYRNLTWNESVHLTNWTE